MGLTLHHLYGSIDPYKALCLWDVQSTLSPFFFTSSFFPVEGKTTPSPSRIILRQLFLHGLMILGKTVYSYSIDATDTYIWLHTYAFLRFCLLKFPFLDFWIRDAWNPLSITDRGSFPTSQLLRPTFPDTRNSPSRLRILKSTSSLVLLILLAQRTPQTLCKMHDSSTKRLARNPDEYKPSLLPCTVIL